MFKPLFVLLLATVLHFETSAQKLDYLSIRDSLTMATCGRTDSVTTMRMYNNLVEFDTAVVGANIKYYYYDLGMAYYKRFGNTHDTNYLRKSVSIFEKSLHHDPNFSGSLWNLALGYCFLENCTSSLYYLNRYKQITPKRKRMKDQNRYIESHCGK
jgi:hypothetical protein